VKGNQFIMLAAFFGLAAVVIGAFGAHGLEKVLAPQNMDRYQTGVDYHFYHTLALLACGILMLIKPNPMLKLAAYAFASGIIIFSGSLYLYAMTSIKTFGMITPIGGLAFVIGWFCLLLASRQSVKTN
jgi:uncharacterized membrane protein YgdD (TMEM256/DUF423 family)